jgi:UDP-glucose-4-epimerase GalE
MSRILVTGGAGYIGSHCCKALAACGFEPVAFDNLHTGHASAVRWGNLIEGDVRDGDALLSAMRRVQPAAVIHFAALALVGESTSHPERYYDVNVGGTLNLLRAMHNAEIGCLVFSSTCAVYGEPERVPMDEALPQLPVNPYGASKAVCERMMTDFEAAHGIRSVRLRYFNAAGADPAAEIGEWHAPETHLIPLALDAALGRRASISVFGTDYPTPDGTALRDYIHVLDLAEAHIAALRHLLAGGGSDALNLGTGHGASVREVIRTVETVTARAVAVTEAPRRAGDPPALIANPRRAEKVLEWRARRDLAAMVEDAWRWHRKLAEGKAAAPAAAKLRA